MLTDDAIAAVFREVHGRAVATLIRSFGDVAEEAVADAFAMALARWPVTGLPESPAGYILTSARHRAIDLLRREGSRSARHAIADALIEAARGPPRAPFLDDDDERAVPDEELRLIFLCCHPALTMTSQVALTLRLVCGLSTAESARALLVEETAMGQRLARAKAKIRDAPIPFRAPDHAERQARMRSALAVIYLIYNEGYVATAGATLVREALCIEALRLARRLVRLAPHDLEAQGLLALLVLLEARRPARTDDDGALVPLSEQHRGRWVRALIDEGHGRVRALLGNHDPGPYQLQAAIQAVHCDSTHAGDTDWAQILALYDRLLVRAPSPVVALHRTVAVLEVHGPAAALALLEAPPLATLEFVTADAIRAHTLAALGRTAEAKRAFLRAAARTYNDAERAHLERRARGLAS